MKRLFNYILLAVMFCCLANFAFADTSGFVPKWQVGDRWILEASYKDLKSPGDVWLPPIKWVFKVKAIKQKYDQDAYVIHIYPKDSAIQMQAVLWLAVKDLRPLRVIDIFKTARGAKTKEVGVDPNNPQPLIAEDTLVPYDLPVFPLIKAETQMADGFDAYRNNTPEKKYSTISKVGGLSFKRTFGQKNKKPERQYSDAFAAYRSQGRSFQVEIASERSAKGIVQLWQEGSKWAISSESKAKRVKLVPPSAPTPLPESGNSNGGDY